MSQHSNGSPSQSAASSLHYHRCWWAWCRHNFYTKKELLNHVISEHVHKTRPVRLSDIHTLQTAENSYWDSLDFGSLPALPASLPIQGENHSQESSRCQANPTDISSSLPSPPASSPQDPSTPVLRQLRTDLSAEDEPLHVPCAPLSPQSPDGLLTPFSKRDIFDVHLFTPSFASLSSQPNSPDKISYDVLDSPCFDLLVAEATRRPIQSVPTLPENEDSNDVVSSPSQESSQEFVFNQLTQGIDDEERSQEAEPRLNNEDNVMDVEPNDVPDACQAAPQPESRISQSDNQEPIPPFPPPLQIQTHFLSTILPSSPSFHSPVYPSMTPVARQSWYQPQRRRPSQKKSASSASAGHPSPVTSPSIKAATPITSPIPVNSLPAAVQAAQSPTSVVSQVFQPALQSRARSQEESWIQTDSTQLSSYPLLTQAPLRSQSMTQD